MRWPAVPRPVHGEKRIVVNFALWPKRIADEWIWLEKYKAVWVVKNQTWCCEGWMTMDSPHIMEAAPQYAIGM